MQASKDAVVEWINNATSLESENQFERAEESYTAAIFILESVLQNPSLSSDDREAVKKYTSDVARRIQRLRAMHRPCSASKLKSTAPCPVKGVSRASSTDTTATATAEWTFRASQNPGDDGLSSMYDSQSKDTVEGAKQPTVRKPIGGACPRLCSNTSSAKEGFPVIPPRFKDPGRMMSSNDGASPPRKLTPPLSSPQVWGKKMRVNDASTLGERDADKEEGRKRPFEQPSCFTISFAPRAPELVLKAIDVATQLCQHGELKRAVDVLQHAYNMTKNERNKPGNFKSVEETLNQMRKRYYEKHPPRFLQDNPVLPDEMALLRQSGITNTIRLPCWDDVVDGYGAENIFMPCEGVWVDSFTPELSEKQKKEGGQLVHIGNLYSNVSDLVILNQADPLYVKQSVVGDCSMVCSLIVCASYQKRFPKAKIISNVIYPQDQECNPIVNPKGKYAVKMLINGMTRLVTIDDRLPANPYTKELLCTYSRDHTELWVSLIEKAFVKVCGGSYEFPGSTSASDLYKLSGWLPDSLQIQSTDFDEDLEWKRLFHSFTRGAVLITLMTPDDLPPKVEQKLKLYAQHAYAVLDLFEVGPVCVVKLRNPWSHFTWAGALSLEDKSDLATEIHKKFGYTKEMADMGVFFMKWEDVVSYFDGASLSWNPYMLYCRSGDLPCKPTRLACHGTYTYTTSMADMPQLHISVRNAPKPTRMHLVFSRHITDVSEFVKHFKADKEKSVFVTLKVYDVTSYPSVAQCMGAKCVFGMCYCRRLISASDFSLYLEPLNDPIYRNAFAHTTSFDCRLGTTQLVVVVACQTSEWKNPFNFTVTLHTELDQVKPNTEVRPGRPSSRECLETGEIPANHQGMLRDTGVFMHWIPPITLKYSATVKGSWVQGATCGGRSENATFVYNPQYRLTFEKPALFSARISLVDCDESCAIFLVRPLCPVSTQRSLTSFSSRVGNLYRDVDLVLKSKLYGVGGALIDSSLPHSLSYDPHHLLGERGTKPVTTLQIIVKGIGTGQSHGKFVMRDLKDNDEISMVFLFGIKSGFAVCPSNATLSLCDRVFEPTQTIKELVEHMHGLDPSSKQAAAGTRSISVCLIMKDEGLMRKLENPTGKASSFAVLQGLVSELLRNNAARANYRMRLNNIRKQALPQQASHTGCTEEPHIEALCDFVTDYIKRLAARPGVECTDHEYLPPLPAGEYTLIPCLWQRGVPGTFHMVVEATEAVTIEPIPPEGADFIEQRINGQLRKNGKPLATRFAAPLRLNVNDEYFENNTVTIKVDGSAIFTCRLLIIEPQKDTRADVSSGEPLTRANVTLFSVNDEQGMDMISSSGPYTSLGVAIRPVVLDRNKLYVLVISASKPSTSKFVLRIYTNLPCSAQLRRLRSSPS